MQAASSADQPQIPQPHRPRKLAPRAQSPHNDGVALPSPSVTNPGGPADQQNKLESPDAAASRRRRPRKLNRPPKSLPSGAEVKDSSSQNAVQTPTAEPSLQREISSLESRVQSLEGQVSELYQRPRPSSTGSRSSRRRGRGGGKAQNAANDSANNGDPQNTPAPEANVVQTRQRPKAIRAGSDSRISYESTITVRETSATPVDEADEEEEVPRVHSPTVETRGADAQRALTLSGNYKIPLPSGISLDDVRNIQSGISSANSLARTLLESRRAASAQAQGQRARSGSVNDLTTSGKQSWSDWIGGRGLSVVSLMNKVEAEAAVEVSRQQSASTSYQQTPRIDKKPAQQARKNADGAHRNGTRA